MCNNCKNKVDDIPEGVIPNRAREAVICKIYGKVIVDYCDYCRDFEKMKGGINNG